MKFFTKFSLLIGLFMLMGTSSLFSQVTTSVISGIVTDAAGEGLIGATVKAVHVPSGTTYGAVTNISGRYQLPAVRVGGPFAVTVTYTGFNTKTEENIYTSLGSATNVHFKMEDNSATLNEVVVVANRNDIFSSDRTGTAQTFDQKTIAAVPVIGARSIQAITKYNANGNGASFGGMDSRLNNFTVDGSVMNNGFGLGTDAQAGGRTGSTAIALDAFQELQVNVAPFDVRQSGFVGAGINAVTKSGDNEIKGTAYYNFRNNESLFQGDNAAGTKLNITEFDEKLMGLTLGGPIIKNKLFFFVSGEMQRKVEPATSWVAADSNTPGQKTRVLKEDMETLSNFLRDKYGYETGAYENYNNETTSDKFLARLDWNVNNNNKLTLRYTHHDSGADQLISNSNSAGFGNRRTNADALSFANSGYIIEDNTRSIVAELNTTLSDKYHNSFIVGYDKQLEDRGYKSSVFPTIDILKDNRTYISTGFDPFTPGNKLDYSTFHATNNFSIYSNKHTYTVGANYEYYTSNNLFYPASNGVYVFNSLADFYAAANSTADTSPVALNLFQYRYSALAGGVEPLQVLKVHKTDLYGQDEYQVNDRLKLMAGIRMGLVSFNESGLENPAITSATFVNENDQKNYSVNTSKFPRPRILVEPRLGFNWDVKGNKKTQLRGGTGIFTGRPPYVFVSNQIGNNGVLTGFLQSQNTTKYKFTDDPSIFTPDVPTLPSTFDIAATDGNFRFPQVWKTSLALDQKLPVLGLIGSVELMYNKNINAVKYFDANMEPATGTFAGPDNRPRFPGSGVTSTAVNGAVRVNDNVSRAAIMTSTNEGYYASVTFKLEKPRTKGLYAMVAYTRSQAKDLMSAGSIASGSYTGARSINGNNHLDLAFADQDIPHRIVGLLSYRLNYGKKFGGATEFSLGYVGTKSERRSYTYAGDMNGDGISGNDLLFVPAKGSDLAWDNLTVINTTDGVKDTIVYNAAAQAAAYDAFIEQDEYLSTRRGQYAERNGVIFPFLSRVDLSVMQELGVMLGKKRNAIQIRFDVLNFTNMLNNEWGVGNVISTTTPLTYRSVAADGTPKYRMVTQIDSKSGRTVPLYETFRKSASITAGDVWQAQVSVRYLFNQ